MAYEISSSVNAGTFAVQHVTGTTDSRAGGGKFSPSGTYLAVPVVRHGGAGSLDQGIDIFTSGASGWTRTDSIDTGSDYAENVEWFSENMIFFETGNSIKRALTADPSSAGGWSVLGTAAISHHGGTGENFLFNPSKTRMLIWTQGQNAPRFYASESAGTFGSNSSNRYITNPLGSDEIASVVWLDDETAMFGIPSYSSNKGRLEVWQRNGAENNYQRIDSVNGQSNQRLGALLYYATSSGQLVVGTGVPGSGVFSNTSKLNSLSGLGVIQSSSADGYLPSSTSAFTLSITSSILMPWGSSNKIARDPSSDERFIFQTRGFNSSPYSAQLHAVESGSSGWKSTLISDEVYPDADRGQIDMSLNGMIVAPDAVRNSENDVFSVYYNFGLGADPSLDDTATETVGSSGGTVKSGGTEGSPTVEVTIPANALSSNTTIGTDVSVSSDPRSNGLSDVSGPGLAAASPIISLTPHGTQFSSAVTVKFRLTGDYAGQEPSDLRIFKKNSNTTGWYELRSNLWSNSAGVVTISTTSFSQFAAGVGGTTMALTKINSRKQITTITGSGLVLPEAIDINESGETAANQVVAADLMILQKAGQGVSVPVSASVLQDFFSSVDVTSSSENFAMKLVFASEAGTPKLAIDNNSLTFNPSSNALVNDGAISGAAGSFDAISGVSLALQGGGITAAGSVAGATSIDGSGDLTMGTITMTGFAVDADGDTALKSLKVDDGSTIGTDSDADMLTLTNGSDVTVASDLDLIVSEGKLKLGSTAVTSTAAELNKLDGADANVTAAKLSTLSALSDAEIGFIDGASLGAAVASKALVVDSSRDIGNINHLTASAIRVTDLDVVTINSIAQTETTLEIADKLIVASVSGSASDSDGGGLRIGGGQNTAGHASVLWSNGDSALDFNIGGSTIAKVDSAGFDVTGDLDVSSDLTAATLTMTGFSVDADGDTSVKTLDVNSGGISNAGAIAGASTIDASGDLTVGSITMSEFTVDSSGNTDIDGTLNVEGVPTFQAGAVFSAGVTTANAIAGATTVSGSGKFSAGGGIDAGLGAEFTVSNAGAVVAASLNNSAGGITNAGSIAGATSIDGSGDLTMGTITMTGFAVDSDGDTALKSLKIDDGSTIGSDSDADMLTLNNGSDVTVASDLDLVVGEGKLKLGSTAVTSTAAELNLLDGVSGLVKADFTKLAAVDASAAELNLLDATAGSSVALAHGDAVIIGDADDSNATKKVLLSDMATLFGGGDGIQVTNGALRIDYVEDIASSASKNSIMADDLLTASLSLTPLTGSVQVYLNGMLMTPSGSVEGLVDGNMVSIFDYIYAGPECEVRFVDAIDHDDVVQIKYIEA